MDKSLDLIMGDKLAPSPLFFDVSYVVISPPQLPHDDPGFTDLLTELDQNGAKRVELDHDTNRIRNMDDITHVISRTADFPDYDTALEQLKHVVKPVWVQVSLAKGKQQNPRQYSPDPALFLNNVTVFCTGIPDGDKEAIYGAVLALGGLCSENFTKLVTHLVALSIDDPVCETAQRKGVPCKIVLPHWFDDCLRLRRRISEQPYLLPDPEILRKDHDGPPTPRNPRSISSAMTPTPSGGIFSSAPTLVEKEITVFNQVKVKLSKDLDISQTTRSTIEDIIQRSGGSVTEDVEEADFLICQYRENNDFVKFWRLHEGKHVGNLSWLYHLIVHNKYSNPLNKLLHFPTPRKGVPGFQQYKLCISNYTGNARIYVENLAKLTGAVYSKTLAQDNTHLIAAHTESEKYDAAQEWNINVVNHVWLEDSYAKMKIQSLTSKSYTHFPSRTNLGEVVGQTPIDRDVVQKWIHATYQAKEDQEKQKSNVINHEAPSVTKSKGVLNGAGDASTTIRKRGRPAGASLVTPATRRVADGKENQLPSSPLTSGSRNAKAKALSKLHDAAVDIALYDKERKRVGGVTHGRERTRTSSESVEPAIESKKNSPKRSHDETEDSGEDELAGPPGKKAKGGRKSAKIRVMVSMYDRWQEKPELEPTDKNKLRNMGIHIVDEPSPSGFVLCAPRIGRTRKFVCALAYGPDVLSTSFLDHCLEKKEIPEFEDYILSDREGEKKSEVIIQDSISRAHQNNRKLLKGWQMFCTERIPGTFATFKGIIEANGGSCYLFKNKTNMTVSKRVLNDEVPAANQNDDGNQLFLISGTTKDEVGLWEPFKKMAGKANMKPMIVRPDWLLAVAMNQRIVWKDEWAHS